MSAEEADMLSSSSDVAACLPVSGARHIECAAQIHGTALHIAQQPDRAPVVLDGLCLDHTGVVDRALQQIASRAGAQKHLSTVSLDQTAVLHQSVDCALVHCHIEQTITGQIQRDGISCGQRHCAQLGQNHTFIADAGAQQGDKATVCLDASLIDDSATATAGELVVARHEVAVSNVQGRGHEAGHIDRRALAKQDAVRIDQEHLAVGRETAEDGRRV